MRSRGTWPSPGTSMPSLGGLGRSRVPLACSRSTVAAAARLASSTAASKRAAPATPPTLAALERSMATSSLAPSASIRRSELLGSAVTSRPLSLSVALAEMAHAARVRSASSAAASARFHASKAARKVVHTPSKATALRAPGLSPRMASVRRRADAASASRASPFASPPMTASGAPTIMYALSSTRVGCHAGAGAMRADSPPRRVVRFGDPILATSGAQRSRAAAAISDGSVASRRHTRCAAALTVAGACTSGAMASKASSCEAYDVEMAASSPGARKARSSAEVGTRCRQARWMCRAAAGRVRTRCRDSASSRAWRASASCALRWALSWKRSSRRCRGHARP
mmetsp:Transcript_11168/g.34636  ORF Transcript_11168/g.34636 Transcript_11168/m.34636 type:complete len:343 (-) Transcript_11168:134-1162(-)